MIKTHEVIVTRDELETAIKKPCEIEKLLTEIFKEFNCDALVYVDTLNEKIILHQE